MERTYNVPLRKEFQKAPKYKRSKKAVTALKEFLVKHMKSEDVRIGRHLNEHIWQRGIKNPPHHVKVTAIKDDEGIVKVELFGFKYEELTKEELEEKRKKEEKKAKKEKKVSEKVKKKPELAEEALEKPEALKEEAKGEELIEELQKEELMDPEVKEDEKEIKETIKEIKAKPVPSAHELAKKAKPKTGKTLKEKTKNSK